MDAAALGDVGWTRSRFARTPCSVLTYQPPAWWPDCHRLAACFLFSWRCQSKPKWSPWDPGLQAAEIRDGGIITYTSTLMVTKDYLAHSRCSRNTWCVNVWMNDSPSIALDIMNHYYINEVWPPFTDTGYAEVSTWEADKVHINTCNLDQMNFVTLFSLAIAP